MNFRCPHFRAGVGATICCAILGIVLSYLPVFGHLGALTLALLLGLLWRASLSVPAQQHLGIGFSARTLLRLGIILLGVRLDFALLAHAGLRILALGAGVILIGLVTFNLLGNWLGLEGNLPMLIAVDSSICGASAVAAASPVMEATREETALVIPLGSLLGTIAMLGYAVAEPWLQLSPKLYGVLTGATLHEIAQVMAANAVVPGAMESGTVTKLIRVTLLVPVVFVIGWWKQRQHAGKTGRRAPAMEKPWFVVGFLAVGLVCSLVAHWVPEPDLYLEPIKAQVMHIAVFLMAMAMAGVGLQVDFAQFRLHGMKSLAVAIAGWGVLAAFAFLFIHFVGI